MLFNSVQFFIFFPIVVGIYFLTPYRGRWIWLLASSYYFYMCWKPEYILLIILSTLIDYYAALQMGKTSNKQQRKKFLILSLISNLGILFAFKYFNFFNDSLSAVFNSFNIFYNVPTFKVLLPVGISFYTFQTLSYSIDVYRGHKEPEKHLGIFALYVAFFPQLVAGPIERSTRLLPQFYQKYDFDYHRVCDGLKLMGWGLFKKVVIADRLAIYVNSVYNNAHDFTGIPLILATYFFAFQIYCDFSGYSDIAIGASRVMGFDLMKNFDRPYFSKSVAEFWKRWHISLSTWFRDYLYIPLGGNRVSQHRWLINIMIVFLISGLWHGAKWTFFIWGALHGFYLLFSIWSKELRAKIHTQFHLDQFPKLSQILSVIITFHLVLFAWIFFRANSLSDAAYIITHLFSNIQWKLTGAATGLSKIDAVVAVWAIIVLEIVHLVQSKRNIYQLIKKQPSWLQWGVYYSLIFSILFFGVHSHNQFIYFQF
ncbi:MAG: MBOAT family protein [Candidatus Omnitrophica bacterium]|nr:MBOAT family protein [Candidatus Omnitrophota bacterium]